MRNHSNTIAVPFLILSLAVLGNLCFQSQLQAEEKWKWSDDRASIMHYFMNSSPNYQVELVRRSMAGWWEVDVKISNGKETLHQFKSHREGNFVFSESLVIYTKHSVMASGCELLAYDLDKQKYAWRTQLKGIGPVDHSKYRNQINLELKNGTAIVYGFESAGQYIEVVDVKTGEMISNQVGKEKHQRFEKAKE